MLCSTSLKMIAVAFVLSLPGSFAIAAQVVYLDFDTETAGGDHVYTVAERDAIQAEMEIDFAAFDYSFTQAAPGAGDFSTIYFNKPPAFGLADQIDFRNLDHNDTAGVELNGFGFTSAEHITLGANVASHELGHLAGLRHGDSFGPIGSGIDPNTVVPGNYSPSYPGPSGADETQNHIMESDSVFIENTVNQFFGEREAVKLAFNEGGSVVAENGAAKGTLATAQAVALAALNVPNTLESGDNIGKLFLVDALVVTGALSGSGEVDFYSFAGAAGDLLNFEVISNAIEQRVLQFDPVITIFDSGGAVVNYYGFNNANHDDEFETLDSIIIDLILPANDTYYARVRGFGSSAGEYELFAYRFAAQDQTGPIAIPEPSTLALLGMGTIGLAIRARRRRAAA